MSYDDRTRPLPHTATDRPYRSPPLRRENPLEIALKNYTDMEEDLRQKGVEVVGLREMLNKALNRVELLTTQLETEVGLKEQFQRYAVEMTTQLNTIQATINQAVDKSKRYGLVHRHENQQEERFDDLSGAPPMRTNLPPHAYAQPHHRGEE